MDWLREHPYASVTTMVAIVLLVGAYIVKERTTVSPDSTSTVAWGGGGGFLQPTAGIQNRDVSEPPDLYQRVQSSAPFWYPAPPTNTSGEGGDVDTFDLDAFIDLISPKKTGVGTDTGGSLLSDAYSFIPRGLIATSTPTTERTPTQEALHAYGNEAGTYVQVFEERNRDMTRVLKDQFEDRQDAPKKAALLGLADSLAGVGVALLAIENVPELAKSTHANLAESYKAMGVKLARVPDAQTDTENIEAMLAYNASVEEFIKSYVALATLFSLSEVTFRGDEPGSVFMFTGGSF